MVLTKEILKKIPYGEIFACGYGKILHPWFNDAKNIDKNNETLVKWVAVRRSWGWKIFHSMDANLEPANYFDGDTHLKASWDRIASHGAGLYSNGYDKDKIRKFVPCTDEVFSMYEQ